MEQIESVLWNRIQAQSADIGRLRTVVQVLTLQIASSISRPKPTLPDPEKFAGSAQKYDTWLPSIIAKLRVDVDAIGADRSRILRFMGLQHNSRSSARLYDNPTKTHEAEDELYSLKQAPTEPISQFVAKFEHVLHEARGQNWPDVNKTSIFLNSLNSTLRNQLSQQLTLSPAYPEFIQITQQLTARSQSDLNDNNSRSSNFNTVDL
ncbi:hypothetical protein TCE0_022r06746 [Talaromyces pinophilus]|uniref:Retrotransposon gag domain-containing protein n=1 Tax=Talaromyces pinophilus TaxID=128442 RepID=A0A6V8H8G3_TALPI|nr:hypothetical protein TCE0_022r06746 [Talaromyces pinophilus]